MLALIDNLLITKNKSVILSFIGAGGKTSFILNISKRIEKNSLLIISTTTAILYPNQRVLKYDLISTSRSINKINKIIVKSTKKLIISNKYNRKHKKLLGFKNKIIMTIKKKIKPTYLFLEADGAKMRPIKAPMKHEPIFPKNTKIVIGCIGLDCIGKLLDENTVHRSKKLLKITKKLKSNTINEKHVHFLISSKQGLFKNTNSKCTKILFLNKADNPKLINYGKKIAKKIQKNYKEIKCTYIGTLKDNKKPIKAIIY